MDSRDADLNKVEVLDMSARLSQYAWDDAGSFYVLTSGRHDAFHGRPMREAR